MRHGGNLPGVTGRAARGGGRGGAGDLATRRVAALREVGRGGLAGLSRLMLDPGGDQNTDSEDGHHSRVSPSIDVDLSCKRVAKLLFTRS